VITPFIRPVEHCTEIFRKIGERLVQVIIVVENSPRAKIS
jgi:hypothetical protein